MWDMTEKYLPYFSSFISHDPTHPFLFFPLPGAGTVVDITEWITVGS